MEKIRKLSEINENLIGQWYSTNIEMILQSPEPEEMLLQAFENGLYETPGEPKINPRELIYAVRTRKNWTSSFLRELKALTKSWRETTSASWTDNVPPYYSVECEYILFLL